MYRFKNLFSLLLLSSLVVTQGCWSSKEIEDLSVYAGLALDVGERPEVERNLERQGANYKKKNLITATIQIVPIKSFERQEKSKEKQLLKYSNLRLTGDSVFEIMRQYSTRRERPVIGHHLKVIVVSTKVAQQHKMDQLMDFVLRDNDIRPSCRVFFSKGKAYDTFISNQPEEVPAFRINSMINNSFRTNKVMNEVNLTRIDGLIHSKQSFLLQNIVSSKGEIEFSGAGIIKGDSSKWIGDLNQENVESLSWIQGTGQGGVIKSYNWRNENITYEIKSMKSKMTAKLQGDEISFHVAIESDGRLIENWDTEENPSKLTYLKEAEKVFEKRLTTMIDHVMEKMQSKYKVDVAGFGKSLAIKYPHKWKKVKDNWDEVFSRVPVTFEIKLKITDFGSSTK
ncbi:Ger(x)C family spore germination protein [Paenibacillus sp. Leaf72]|uniref:Ger(x)C family spore germination protein n=1 Tax=Paenibacillus sp. Leaf72 TaxID=1736234 RepID=UPI0006FE114E|nr:Ger(x)C family spore germination protein [Paenibacillus sp. Leaf72]KQN97731.1 spore gernimation protein GerC [Paenibacillus sp. Leaf72]